MEPTIKESKIFLNIQYTNTHEIITPKIPPWIIKKTWN